jgi:hypothetical protein
MDELHGYRALTNSRGHAFDRTMPHVADGEETGNIGFKQEGVSV